MLSLISGAQALPSWLQPRVEDDDPLLPRQYNAYAPPGGYAYGPPPPAYSYGGSGPQPTITPPTPSSSSSSSKASSSSSTTGENSGGLTSSNTGSSGMFPTQTRSWKVS